MKTKILKSLQSLTDQTKAVFLLTFVLTLAGTGIVLIAKYFIFLWNLI